MHTTINREKEIFSCHDFELERKRPQKLKYRYSYPASEKLNGIVLIIAGFVTDTDSQYSEKLRRHIAKKFSVVAVSVEYHCFSSRPSNGAQLIFDASDIYLLKENLKKDNIYYSDDESPYNLLNKWETFLQKKGTLDKDSKPIITMTINPKKNEYQNFGIMQALDHVSVLNDLENMSFNFIKNSTVTLMGSSHGGYIANLTAKLVPSRIDCVIDNSSYVKPPLKYIVGKEVDVLNPEFFISKEYYQINCFVKTPWTLNHTQKNDFSQDRYRIRDILDKEHLEQMASGDKRTKYISYHSSKDSIAPIEDKIELYEALNELGFEAKLHVIDDSSQVDGKFIKTFNHGMDMSLQELANRELEGVVKKKSTPKPETFTTIYRCDTMQYILNNSKTGYSCVTQTLIEESKGTLSVEDRAMQTYHDNIDYLEKQQPRLFKQLSDFEVALDKGFYKEKYELEYKNEGYFDVKELDGGKYFYGVDSDEYAKKASSLVNFKKNESVFKTYYDYEFSKEELDRYDNEDISSSSYYAYAKIMDYTKQVAPETSMMKKIHKFIFFGVGLGTHIEEIDKKIQAENYLIIEDDLELFRLSLFTTNYKKLSGQSRLFFCIFEDDDSARAIFKIFLDKSFYYNHYIKYFQMHSSDDSKMKIMHTNVIGQDHLIFLFSSYFKVYLRALTYLKEGYNFLDMSRKDIRNDTFDNKPVMIVAAGPSLSKNLDWLEKNRDKFVIVALSATLNILEKRQITPDIITHLDPFEKTCMVHLDAVKDKSFYKDSLLFCGSQTPDVLIKQFNKEKVYIAQVNLMYKEDFDYIQPICVGSATYMMLVNLGAKEVYTLGLDLAIDSKTGMSHAKEHAYNRLLKVDAVDDIEDTLGYLKAVVKIKGNFEEKRLATLTYHKSIVAMDRFTKSYKQDFQNIYNLNDGAYLEGFIPTKVKSVKVDLFEDIDKGMYIEGLLVNLKKKSSNAMTDDELDAMKKRLNYVQKLLTSIEKSKHPQSFNGQLYQSQLLTLTLDILDENDTVAVDLHNTYLSYLHFILPFVFDMLNTSGIKNEKKHIKKVHKYLIRYTLEIAKYYEKHVEEFFIEELVD